jgi:DNA repair exonuclease SbcCD ATPase subunit
MDTPALAEARLQAEIEALRAQFPDTQDLYREVCVVLFFRHGITPTANKLYQLVRKGSMGAPAEALNKFWETLREKSRIRIEQPDLPESLRDAAGELVSVLWQRAQAAAQDALAELRIDAQAKIAASQSATLASKAQADSAQSALDTIKLELAETNRLHLENQASLARVQGEAVALQRQVDDALSQRRELQVALKTAQMRLTTEIDQQRAVVAAMEERHATETRRLLVDVDRERTNATKLQKDLEHGRRIQAEQTDALRQECTEVRQQLAITKQRNGELEGAISELRGQRDKLMHDIDELRFPKTESSKARATRESKARVAAVAGAKTSRTRRE